jgi:hypothetical protein
MTRFSDDPARADLLFGREPTERDIKIAMLFKGALDCLDAIQRTIERYDDFRKDVTGK